MASTNKAQVEYENEVFVHEKVNNNIVKIKFELFLIIKKITKLAETLLLKCSHRLVEVLFSLQPNYFTSDV